MNLKHSHIGSILRRVLLQAHRENLLEKSDDAGQFSRRRFIGAGLASGAAAMLPSCSSLVRESGPVATSEKVAIIGGGIAGLSAAHELHKRGIACEIFEASNRFGGRMFTKRNFNADKQFCEIGGELIDSNHHEIRKLAKDLDLEVQKLDDGTSSGEDLYQFGGKLHGLKDAVRAFRPLAALIKADEAKLRNKDKSYTAYAHQLDRESLESYLDRLSHGAEPWIIATLKTAYTGEFGTEPAGQSALNLVDFIGTNRDEFVLYGESDEAWRIKGGNGTLPEVLAARLQRHTAMHAGHQLERIRDVGGRLHLTFSVMNGPTKTIAFNRVITTLPFPLLRRVDGVSALGVSAAKRGVIEKFGLGSNTKLMCSFKERYWERKDLHLPEPSNGCVFSDQGFQNCWETSRAQHGKRGILTNFMGGSLARRGSSAQEFIGRLEGVLPGIGGQFDGNTFMINWYKQPHTGGSYTVNAPGQYINFSRIGAKPELGGRLLFAGEQTSLVSSGFMNGGVESGVRAANELTLAVVS